MKPKDLPFYDFEARKQESPSKQESVEDDGEGATKQNIEKGVKNVRLFIQENSKPLQTTMLDGYNKAKGLWTKGEASYDRIYHPNMWYNFSVIGGSVLSGMVLQALLFRKSSRVRRLLTPVVFGTVSTIYFYPDRATNLWNNFYQSGVNKYEDVKKRLRGDN